MAADAPSREVAVGHEQLADLYRVQLYILTGGHDRVAEVSRPAPPQTMLRAG